MDEREGTDVAPRLTDADVQSVSTTTQHVYRVEIEATAARIWTAITDPEWTVRYGYRGAVQMEHRVGGEYTVHKPEGLRIQGDEGPLPAPEVLITGVVTVYDPPRRLSVLMRFLVDSEASAEPATHVRYEVDQLSATRCSLTIVHDVEGAPRLAAVVSGELRDRGAGGGHPFLLRELKRLLESQDDV
ncbi:MULTISPECIES: SRPBCC domain-containing protein [unclassified Microbacterium]|nr:MULTISPECIES: SRPBCC domain-containing protein [unclassified Microbacterium]MCR2810669.1 SRPBCC domain-containing protein [Microbacterium sp. zg.B185]WIM18206.1 SRPBCC domain-containing protein [Microbacterium sp. zg-B185]